MKLTFIYNNRKSFTASNVVENSLVITRDSEGRPQVSYQKIITVDGATVLKALAAILPRPADFKESGIVSQLVAADSILYEADICEIVEIDAAAAGLMFIVVSENDYDDTYTYLLGDVMDYSSSEYTPPLAIVPIMATRIKPAELADALTLFF